MHDEHFEGPPLTEAIRQQSCTVCWHPLSLPARARAHESWHVRRGRESIVKYEPAG